MKVAHAVDVTVVAGDTAAAALGLGGFASRQTVTAGSSVHIAAQTVAAKARKLLKWRPLFSLNEGLEKTVNWYRDFLDHE